MPAITFMSFCSHPVFPYALSRHLGGGQAGKLDWIAFAATSVCDCRPFGGRPDVSEATNAADDAYVLLGGSTLTAGPDATLLLNDDVSGPVPTAVTAGPGHGTLQLATAFGSPPGCRTRQRTSKSIATPG